MFIKMKNKLCKNKLVLLINKRYISYFIFLYGLLLSKFCYAGDASVDPLKDSVKPQIEALLGPGSTVAYGIYLAEIIFGSVVYIKGKNPLTLLGVPILVLFTHTMFDYVGK